MCVYIYECKHLTDMKVTMCVYPAKKSRVLDYRNKNNPSLWWTLAEEKAANGHRGCPERYYCCQGKCAHMLRVKWLKSDFPKCPGKDPEDVFSDMCGEMNRHEQTCSATDRHFGNGKTICPTLIWAPALENWQHFLLWISLLVSTSSEVPDFSILMNLTPLPLFGYFSPNNSFGSSF